MHFTLYKTGYISGIVAFGATLAFVIAQALQLLGILQYPLDEIAIYAASLLITFPLLLTTLALHYIVPEEVRIWSHAALLFTLAYIMFVGTNYIAQLAVVIPATLSGNGEAVAVLSQTPHSLFWFMDGEGYIAMGIAAFFAHMSLHKAGFEGRVRTLLLLHSLTTPLILVVYCYPEYSPRLLLLALPWAITAPAFMLALAILFRRKYINESPGHRLVYKHLR